MTWGTAYKYLQDALSVATAGDDIHVAAGTYKPDQDEAGNVPPGERTESFQMQDGLQVLGGYRGLSGGGSPAIGTFLSVGGFSVASGTEELLLGAGGTGADFPTGRYQCQANEFAKLTTTESSGSSVSISGDVAVIGASGDDRGGSNSGAAYVFRFNGFDWIEEAKLTASDPAVDDFFGKLSLH